jgi:hypothetical protein
MAQVDHRIGQSFEGIVDIGDELVANQHTTKSPPAKGKIDN